MDRCGEGREYQARLSGPSVLHCSLLVATDQEMKKQA